MKGDVLPERDLQFAPVVGKTVRIGQLGLRLGVVVHFKQPFVDQPEQADHVALIQLQRAEGEMIIRDNGDGKRRGNRKADSRQKQQHTGQQQRGEMGNAHGKTPYGSVGSMVSTGK